MEQLEKYSWLDEFLDSTEKSFGFMDLSTVQPTSWRHFQPLLAQEWLEWFERIIDAREAHQVPFEKVAEAFSMPLARDHLFFTLEDLKVARWPKEKRLQIADFFYQILKAQAPFGDLFGSQGTTRRHSSEDIKRIRARAFEQGSPAIARELGKLYNVSYNLGAALYSDFYMDMTAENYGPYPLPDGTILVIKLMSNLCPKEVWPGLKTTSNNIAMYVIYENVEFSTDLISCHSQYKGDIINGLKEWRLERDGEPVTDIEEIKHITQNIGEVGMEQWQHVMGLPEKELIEKILWIRCYTFNKLCTLLGLDWRPTKAMLYVLEGKTLEQGWNTWKQPTEAKAFNEYWRKIWDPRIEFYP